jgi:3-dehydroquinate synthase
MRTIEVALGARTYPIHIGDGLLPRIAEFCGQLRPTSIAIVTNDVLERLHLPAVEESFARAGMRTTTVVVPDGESLKTLESWSGILDRLLAARLDRKSLLVALGGGVIGDLGGFAAAVYQRGIPFVQVPTTLLSQVDSSVGGKTGVNHPAGKNMIGAFYQPRLVLIDTSTLMTLPDRELRAGLAEVIKYGLIRDRAFFEWLEENIERLLRRDREALMHAIETSCRHKAEVVASDETEQGERALLNLGHTFGHAIEAGLGYGEWLHGEAVAAGSALAARLSARLGWLAAADVERIEQIFTTCGLPTDAPKLGPDRYLELMMHDKKSIGGKIRLILLREIGNAVVWGDTPIETMREIVA